MKNDVHTTIGELRDDMDDVIECQEPCDEAEKIYWFSMDFMLVNYSQIERYE